MFAVYSTLRFHQNPTKHVPTLPKAYQPNDELLLISHLQNSLCNLSSHLTEESHWALERRFEWENKLYIFYFMWATKLCFQQFIFIQNQQFRRKCLLLSNGINWMSCEFVCFRLVAHLVRVGSIVFKNHQTCDCR